MAENLTDKAGCCSLHLSGADADGTVFVCLTDSDGKNHTIKVDARTLLIAAAAVEAEATGARARG
ncbi:MAG TPA: hypothetical protein VF867_09430 [Arthrobacter sp.]